MNVAGLNGALTINSNRQRIVLALLIINANRLVPVERLVDAVWNDDPPTTARAQIHTCVSNIRRFLKRIGLGDRITTRFPGYILHVNQGEIDLHDFDARLIHAAENARSAPLSAMAVADLRDAVGRCTGTPFVDVESRIVQSVTAQLIERKVSAIEECIEAEIQLGRHHEVLDELMALIAEYPLRSRLRALHMTALHQAGRRVEALEAYQQFRTAMVEELGVEPGAELRSVHMRILSDDESLPAQLAAERSNPYGGVPLTPRLLPPDTADFVGRSAELALLRQKAVPAGPPSESEPPTQILAISEMAGLGKTCLALHSAHELADHFADGQLYAELCDKDARPIPPDLVLERFLLALRAVSARLNARPHWTVGQMLARLNDKRRRLDELAYGAYDVRASLLRSYRHLGSQSRRLLALLALCDYVSFPAWLPSSLLDCPPDAGVDILDTLVDAQLVQAVPATGQGRYCFQTLVHLFARERLLAEVSEGDRLAAWRRVAASWLFLIDEACGRIPGCDHVLVRGDRVRRQLPPFWTHALLAQPLAWLDRSRPELLATLRRAARTGDDNGCWDLALGMSRLFEAGNHLRDWHECVDTAIPPVLRAKTGWAKRWCFIRRDDWLWCSTASMSRARSSWRPGACLRILGTHLRRSLRWTNGLR
jgi:DNA-binding SARP family transcriptional activator